MGTVVQITAKEVKYSLNNFLLSEFEENELYEVPSHVADGMVKRGWAKLSAPSSPPEAQPRQPSEPKEEATKPDDKKRGKP